MGYSNFGDILQLKNEVRYHLQRGVFTPVIILRLNAPYGYKHEAQNLDWLGADNICYIADDNEATPDGLVEIDRGSSSHYLHVYGGGFLNSFWGEEMLEEIVSVVEHLTCGVYLFSGQQVSEDMSEVLQKKLAKNPPITFGVRDKLSLEYMRKNAPSIDVKFSFDDITEILVEWSQKQNRSTKIRLKSLLSSSVAWHFNTTKYVSSGQSLLLEKISKVRDNYDYNCVLLQAYNDGSSNASDTLQTVISLENAFPYTSYSTLNLAQLALGIDVRSNSYPQVAGVLSGVKFAVTSSYHTAMFCVLLGIPSYLMVENEYYAQKQRALGLETNFDAFLKNPALKSGMIMSQIEERQEWLSFLDQRLAEVLDKKV